MEKIGIIGGDQRQIYVKQFLEEHGWQTETASIVEVYVGRKKLILRQLHILS